MEGRVILERSLEIGLHVSGRSLSGAVAEGGKRRSLQEAIGRIILGAGSYIEGGD